MSFVFKKIIKSYEKENPNVLIKAKYSSSGKLFHLMKYNAKIDIFLSADINYANKICLIKKCIKKNIYASGSLILLYPKSLKVKQDIKKILSKSKKIIIANPKIAPYGKASQEVLENLNININNNDKTIIKASSISKAMTFTLKSKNTGFIAKNIFTSLKEKNMLNDFYHIKVNPKLHSAISKKMVLFNSKSIKFYDFILMQTMGKVKK